MMVNEDRGHDMGLGQLWRAVTCRGIYLFGEKKRVSVIGG